MRLAASQSVESSYHTAEVLADSHLKEELRTMARRRGVATSGAKLEIAMRMQGLIGGRRE